MSTFPLQVSSRDGAGGGAGAAGFATARVLAGSASSLRLHDVSIAEKRRVKAAIATVPLERKL